MCFCKVQAVNSSRHIWNSISEMTKELAQLGEVIESTQKRPLSGNRKLKKHLLVTVIKEGMLGSAMDRQRTPRKQLAMPGAKTKSDREVGENKSKKEKTLARPPKKPGKDTPVKVSEQQTKGNKMGGGDKLPSQISSRTRSKIVTAQSVQLDGCLKKATSVSKSVSFAPKCQC